MAELRHVMRNIGEDITEEELNDILKEGDRDGDGIVDYSGTYLLHNHFCNLRINVIILII